MTAMTLFKVCILRTENWTFFSFKESSIGFVWKLGTPESIQWFIIIFPFKSPEIGGILRWTSWVDWLDID